MPVFTTPTKLRLTSSGIFNLDHFSGSRLGSGGVITNGVLLEIVSAALSGTALPTQTEVDVVNGGKTIIITLTGDTWVAGGAPFDAVRQDIIDGITSAQSELTGWNNEVIANELVTSVVRTSNTVVTVTLSAALSYDITADETISVLVPSSALTTSGSSILADTTFTVIASAGGGFNIVWALSSNNLIGGI